MNRLAYPTYRSSPYVIVVLSFALYVAAFAYYHDSVGVAVGSLATIPVICGSWYFGIKGGLLTASLSIVANIYILLLDKHHHDLLENSVADLIGTFSLFLVAMIVGRISTIARERRTALVKLEQYEKERQQHTHFLEKLNKITARALEADSLQVTLEILTEQIAGLFGADDVFFSFWDKTLEIPLPTVAYGSMVDIYPDIQFEPGEVTPTTSVLKAEHPLAILDAGDSPYISQRLAALFPSRSMLGIPLITQGSKLGAILLGFNQKRLFDDRDIFQAGIIAEQLALVLSKVLLLEDERKQVRRLTALHDVAITSIEVENEDELIERVTDIIGDNLFPDNFGIMMLDEKAKILRAHPSYRFRSVQNISMKELRVGEGISGNVARTGQSQRISNVRLVEYYVDVDDRTVSELCVPIKFKEKVLGVINAESTKRDAFSADDERLLVTLAGQLATTIEQLRRSHAERKWLDQLAHSNDLIYSIAHITTQIERSMSADEIIRTLGDELENIGLTCIMAAYDKEKDSFTINYTSLSLRSIKIVEAGLGYPMIRYTFSRDRIASMTKAEDMLRPTILVKPENEITTLFTRTNPQGVAVILQKIGVTAGIEPMRLPLVFENNLIGILWVWGKDLGRSDLPIMSIFAKQLGISLERARLFQEVQNLAFTDPLTGLQNRRSVFELGRIEFSRAQRMDRPFCCMMVDLDHFKTVNDNYGHQTGDLILQEFANRFLHSMREVDLVGRYGGEEFIVLMPETNRDMALRVAERLRSILTEKPFLTADMEINITASIGVAAKDENTLHLETLIARADQALYIAKHKGRNRVAISV